MLDAENSHPPRLIAGLPRAATTWLCRCFNEHPDTAAFGETLYWGRWFVEPRGGDGRYTPEQVDSILDRLKSGECITSVIGPRAGSLRNVNRENLPRILDSMREHLPQQPTPGELFMAVCEAIKTAEGRAIIVEKTPHHINWLDRIMADFADPDIRVVVLLRDPYSFMLSYKHQGDRKGETARRNFRRRYHPLACAMVWRTCTKAAMSAAARYPNQILIVENEDIRRDPASVLDRVQSFYELPRIVPGREIAAKVKPENTSFPERDGAAAPRPQLRGDDVFWMNLVGGRTIEDAGYTRRHVPLEPLRIAWSIVRLPIWATWNLLNMKRHVGGSLLAYLWRWMSPPRKATGIHGAKVEASNSGTGVPPMRNIERCAK